MKKILFVTRDVSYVGGTEVFVKNILIELARRGNYKLYLLEIEGSGKFENKNIYKLLKTAGIKLLKININKGLKDIALPIKIKWLGKIIQKYDINIVHSFLFNADFLVYLTRSGSEKAWSTLSKIKSFKSLCRILPSLIKFKEENFKPIHFRWLSSKMIDVSISLEENTPEWVERKRIIDNELEPIVSRSCDVVLPVFKKGLQKWRKFSRRTFLLPCASISKADISYIDTRFLMRNKLRKAFGFDSSKRVFASVARLTPVKGFERLIPIFKKEGSFSKNVLFIAGTGPLEKKLKQISKSCKNIHFIGQLNREGVFDFLVASDIFVLLSNSEGLPLSIQEAMAAKKPIWATNVGGNSDLVSDKNGFLCKVDDSSSIYKTFNYINTLSNSVLIKMGEMSRKKIVHHYMLEKICDALEIIYSKL